MHRTHRTLSLRVALSLSASAATVAALLTTTPAQAQNSPAAATVRHLGASLIGFQDKSAVQYYNDGAAAFSANKFDEAITAFTNAIKKRTGAPYADAYYGRGVCYNRKREYAKAVADFNEALKVKPNLGEAYLERAGANAGLGKFQEALADYTTAEQKGANRSEVIKFRGSMYFQMKDYDKAIADWKAYIAAVPNAKGSEAIYYNIGLAYLEKKQYPQAVEAFTNALKAKPDYAAAFSGRAEAYLGQMPKDFAKAAADAEAALKADPSDEYSVNFAAEAYEGLNQNDKLDALVAKYPNNVALLAKSATGDLKAGRFKPAIDKFTKFLSKEPNNAPAQTNLAAAYLGDKQYANAIRAYDGVIKLDAKNAVAYHNRGVANYYLDKPDAAIADFDQAIKLDPKYYEAYVNKSLAASKLASAPGAKKESFQLVVDAATAAITIKDTPEVRYRRGAAYYNMEQYQKAIPDLEAYQKSKPSDPEVSGLLAVCYEKTGNIDTAIAKLKEAIVKSPKDPINYLDLGRLYMSAKKYQEAIEPLTQAITLKPTDVDAKYNRGLAQFNLKNWTGAKTDMDAVLTASPKNASALLVRADAQYNLKQYKPAIADYGAYLASTPPPSDKDKEYAQKGMADAAVASGDPKMAIDAWTSILKGDPNNMEALKMRGISYLKDKQYVPAKTDLEAVAAKSAMDADVFFNLGLVYRESKETVKEAEAFEKSATIKPDYAAGSNAGVAYTKLATQDLIDSDPKKAVAYLDKAIAMFDIAVKGENVKPDNAAVAYFNKAVAYEKKAEATQDDSQLKGAVEAYTKYLELKPNAEDKKAVQDTIAELKGRIG